MVEIQRSPQETAELTVQTQQEKISQAIYNIKAESNEDFNNINELINKNFFNKIEQSQAERIINIIDDLFKQWWYNKDLKDLREFLEPKAAKTISSFGQSNEYIPDTKIVLDSNGKSQLQIINAQISTLESSLWNNKELKDIITELKNITNNLNNRNKEQLVTFLTDNWISGISENTWNTELLQWVNLFLRNINKHLTDIDESNNILNERNENTNRFNEFLQTINDWKRENLDKFNNKEDLQRLQTFIEQNPGNKGIMKVYLNMKGIQIKEQNNTHHQDRKVFENILNILENEYWENGKQHKEFQQYILDVKFDTRKIKEDNKWLMNLCTNWLKLNRNWNNINKGTPNIQNFCKSRWFNVDQFIKKFNGINQKRIDNNVQQLKDFNILSVISEGELKKFTIEEITEGNVTKPQLKYTGAVLSAEWTDLISTLWLQDKAKSQLKENPWNTNFVDEEELTQLINSSSDIQTARYEKIFDEIKKSQEKEDETVQQTNFENEVDQEFKNLPNLDTSSIKKVFSGLKKEDIVKFFNEQKAREDLTERQKSWLTLTYKGLTKRFTDPNDNTNRWKKSITVLQQYMNDKNDKIVIDWKFGKQTFNELCSAFWEKTQWSDTNNSQKSKETDDTTPWEVMFGNEKLTIQHEKESGKNFVEINWKRYYEYTANINWLWYDSETNTDGVKYTYVWDYVDGKCEWHWIYILASGEKYEWKRKNDKAEWQWTLTRASGEKYEWERKNGNMEWQWTRTWANWRSVKWTFANGLTTPTKFIENSNNYDVVLEGNLLKIVSPWEYEGRYIDLNTWEFIDEQIDNQAAGKEIKNYDDLLSKLKDMSKLENIWTEEIVYKPNENTTFHFTKKGCRLQTSDKEINFKKRGTWLWYYTADNGDIGMYMKNNFIYIYSISKWPIKKLYYPSWAEFTWKSDSKSDSRGILEEWIMTYPNRPTFEWSFKYDETTHKVKPDKSFNVDFNTNFWVDYDEFHRYQPSAIS